MIIWADSKKKLHQITLQFDIVQHFDIFITIMQHIWTKTYRCWSSRECSSLAWHITAHLLFSAASKSGCKASVLSKHSIDRLYSVNTYKNIMEYWNGQFDNKFAIDLDLYKILRLVTISYPLIVWAVRECESQNLQRKLDLPNTSV